APGSRLELDLREVAQVDLVLRLKLVPVAPLLAVASGSADGVQQRLPAGAQPVPQFDDESVGLLRFEVDVDGEVIEVAPVLASGGVEFQYAVIGAALDDPACTVLAVRDAVVLRNAQRAVLGPLEQPGRLAGRLEREEQARFGATFLSGGRRGEGGEGEQKQGGAGHGG